MAASNWVGGITGGTAQLDTDHTEMDRQSGGDVVDNRPQATSGSDESLIETHCEVRKRVDAEKVDLHRSSDARLVEGVKSVADQGCFAEPPGGQQCDRTAVCET